ncbi:MAG TPA: amino acid permease [Gammaproteobacteria bacterium]|nr:amino acid permease [Gammaproteobacteria bacterium]
MSIFRTKMLHQTDTEGELKRCLTAFDLTLLGIGAIIGAGIFVITGIVAATQAGPGIVLSYGLAGIACSFAALTYAELAASIRGSGSAYNYAYAGLGEIVAWIIGWDLILEYGVGTSVVAIGWSGYLNDALLSIGISIPVQLLKNYAEGGFINLPAVLIILTLCGVLMIGVKQSARFNMLIVFIKLAAIALFIALASTEVQPHNWTPFMPFGWKGVMEGAALVFFAFIGFDAVSTAGEEAKNPQKDLSLGIIGSLGICTALYIAVSGLLTGIVSYTTLNTQSPVAEAILNLGHKITADMIALGAIAGLTSTMLIFTFAGTRVVYSMSKDGLIPPLFSRVHPKTQTPIRVIAISGIVMSLIAGFFPMKDVAELVNIGTLAAFVIVCISAIILRITKPDLPRPFKTPFNPLIPVLGVISCGYLMISLPWTTWLRFIIWMVIGIIIYAFYGYRHSKLSKK